MSDQPSDFANFEEHRSSSHSTAALGLALLFLGLAGGAIAALLLTPKTGKQMRRSLRRKYEDARDVVDDWGEQAGDWVEKSSDLKNRASDWADTAKDRASDWAGTAKDRASDWAGTAKKKVAPLSKKFRG
jgi:gas vesicle protein